MLAYLVRRSAYGLFVVLGVIFFLFVLFFTVASPDDIARQAVGPKAMPEAAGPETVCRCHNLWVPGSYARYADQNATGL